MPVSTATWDHQQRWKRLKTYVVSVKIMQSYIKKIKLQKGTAVKPNRCEGMQIAMFVCDCLQYSGFILCCPALVFLDQLTVWGEMWWQVCYDRVNSCGGWPSQSCLGYSAISLACLGSRGPSVNTTEPRFPQTWLIAGVWCAHTHTHTRTYKHMQIKSTTLNSSHKQLACHHLTNSQHIHLQIFKYAAAFKAFL